jgi:23S rRNA (cytidine1920-2'-O)/16S rRNA (cytidine1409-2'-O)-methyltransferase
VPARQRLDLLLVERGLAPTREKARALVMAGVVRVQGQRADKAGTSYPTTVSIEVAGPTLRYVSRGGLKLERALDVFGVSPAGRVCLDVGASTGGFTDCLLQRGAARVYAIDVGYGQLDVRLRDDPRVISRERVNARRLGEEEVAEPVSLVVVDVSFISLGKVLPAAVSRMASGQGELIALVKPQFEAGPKDVGKGGVVRDPAVHRRVLVEAVATVRASGLSPRGIIPSPILGPAGNVEFLLRACQETSLPAVDIEACIESAVVEAHSRPA